MYKIVISWVLFSLVFSSCGTLPKNYVPIQQDYISINKECADILESISTKWGHHNEYTSCFFYNRNLISETLSKKDCFINLNVSDTKLIFGNPSLDIGSSLRYNLSEGCTHLDTLAHASGSLIFWYDSNKKITRISKSTGYQSH